MKKVRDCYTTMSTGVDIVSPEATIDELVKSVSRAPASRSVFVVDEKKGLVGIIHARQLLLLFGAKYELNVGMASSWEFMARRAEDIMTPPSSVSPDDDLEVALRLAVRNELDDIPVVDNGKVVGNLDCLEIIVNYEPDR